jgi:hypothetical protein
MHYERLYCSALSVKGSVVESVRVQGHKGNRCSETSDLGVLTLRYFHVKLMRDDTLLEFVNSSLQGTPSKQHSTASVSTLKKKVGRR